MKVIIGIVEASLPSIIRVGWGDFQEGTTLSQLVYRLKTRRLGPGLFLFVSYSLVQLWYDILRSIIEIANSFCLLRQIFSFQ